MLPSTWILSISRRRALSANNVRIYRIIHTNGRTVDGGDAIQRLKHPGRGGQNLSARYARLERSLRGKEEYLGELEGYRDAADDVGNMGTPRTRKQPKQLMFRGFVVPEEPKAPEPDECCMSGCAVCVHDLYQESLEAYDTSVKALRASLSALRVVESEWPAQIQPKSTDKGLVRKKDIALSAFEQMELQLAAKREKKTSVVDVDTSAPAPIDSRSDTIRSAKKKQGDLNAGALLEAINWVVFSRK